MMVPSLDQRKESEGELIGSSNDSSISGPVDVEENIPLSETKALVADFHPHSNKNLL
jgi:hypothetical protein